LLEARALLDSAAPSAFMVDAELMPLSDLPGFFERHPDVAVFILTENEQSEHSLRALELGALDCCQRPLDNSELELALARVRAQPLLVEPARPSQSRGAMIYSSAAMLRVEALVQRAASSDATVLIRGETGTGKDLIAREIHAQSPRSAGPFIKVHAAALPDTLLESELFGYEKGAFTGAVRRKAGRVELAAGGSFFLDEIGDISPALQVKLLRVLQDKEFERVGGTQTLSVNVRFLAATHRDLSTMVSRGEFREDLLYRLNVVTVWLPPLRARRADIPLLAQAFCEMFRARHSRPNLTLDHSALAFLQQQRWPGNVRQLQHLIERLVLLGDSSVITAEIVSASLCEEEVFQTEGRNEEQALPAMGAGSSPGMLSSVRPLRHEVALAERAALSKALAQSHGNRTLAARLLGISRQTLYAKLEEHGIRI